MMQWIAQNIQYPKEAAKANIEGSVIVSFFVEKDGSISNAEVIKSVHELLDKEALRVVNAMPKWKPGMENGQPVRARFFVPISFKSQQSAEAKEEVSEFLEDMPEFPGGGKAMMQWIAQNIQYPKEAAKANIEGSVIVSFLVEKDGSISNVEVIKSVHELLDKEALRVVNAMPKWKPGMEKGQPVRARFHIPVIFKICKPVKAPTE